MADNQNTALILNKTSNGKIATYKGNTSRPVSFLSENEVYELVDQAKTLHNGERYELLILTLFQCALRITEAVQLRLKDKAAIEGRPVLLVIGKGHKPRIVAIPEKLSYHLGDYAQRLGICPEGRLFPVSRVRAWQVIKECADKAGISRRVYLHLLRHTGAIQRLKRTGNPKSLQVYLGHADIKMTMRYLSTLQAIDSIKTESAVEFER
jgi:integrase